MNDDDNQLRGAKEKNTETVPPQRRVYKVHALENKFNNILKRANSHLYWQSFPRDLERCQQSRKNHYSVKCVYVSS